MMTHDGQMAWAHGPGMRFIDQVIHADTQVLVARIGQLAPDHPLMQQDRIGVAILIEYAAQAAAAHAPYSKAAPRKAYLAAVRAVDWNADALTDALLPFDIEVVLEGCTEAAARYAFTVRNASGVWARGQLTLAYVGGGA